VALVIEIDHLEAQMLAHEFFQIADRLAADLRGRNEAAHAEVDEDAALDDLRDRRFDHFVVVVRGDDLFPRLEGPGAPLREEERAFLIDAVDHHLELVADEQSLGSIASESSRKLKKPSDLPPISTSNSS
jgi:hypothetical protein